MKEGGPDQTGRRGAGLEVLWVDRIPEMQAYVSSNRVRLGNLVSLRLENSLETSECISLLANLPLKTLKHIALHTNLDVEEVPPLPFRFETIEVFEFSNLSNQPFFPSWVMIPITATLMVESNLSGVCSSLPSVSTLWLTEIENVQVLGSRCPELVRLRMDPEEIPDASEWDELVLTLQQRKKNVEAGIEVDGVKMIPLKTLVFPFKAIEAGLSFRMLIFKLKTLVEEVVDLATEPSFVTVEF